MRRGSTRSSSNGSDSRPVHTCSRSAPVRVRQAGGCWISVDEISPSSTLRGGAQVLVVQTNNATYTGTGQIEQQFAITRARAMESRREIAVATTNSVSGFITRDGAVATRTQEFTAQSMVVEMPLRSALTPAITVAPWLERGLALVAVLACVAALWHRTQRSRGAKLEQGSIRPRNQTPDNRERDPR